MKGSVVEIRAERGRPLNAISLKNAVLCADCDVVSDSPHDHCLVCGSRSLFNISRLVGGMLPSERATLMPASLPVAVALPVLAFPRPHRAPPRTHPRWSELNSRIAREISLRDEIEFVQNPDKKQSINPSDKHE
jgi:hypothetical protein